MIPGAFEYHRPGSVDEVVKLMTKYGDDGRVIAGGHSLLPMMKLRLAVPEHLIDLRDVEGLGGISRDGGTITIGAMATQHEALASDSLREHCPILQEASELIADPQVRYFGTIGGNVANGDPGNDLPAVMQCLDASYVLHGPNGKREVPARSFYEGAYFTAMADDELLVAIKVPVPAGGHGYSYQKLKRKVGDYATAAAAVILSMDGDTCASAAIAMTNVGETPLFAEAAGRALVGSKLDEPAIAKAVEEAKKITDPASDLRGPADYRTHVAGVMVRRAIAAASARASGR